MSNYDLMAISQKPDFYFSSNSSSDQSGQALYGLTNGTDNIGQPIISGNPSSWRVAPGDSIVLDANPIFFREGVEIEFVIQMMQPTQTVCVFGDTDELNGIFVLPGGVEVRFVDSNLMQKNSTILFSQWAEKMHIILSFDPIYCTLRINDQTAQVRYRETDPDSILDVSFKTISSHTYYIDGIGVYSDNFESKRQYVQAPQFDYLDFINKTYSATGTLFDSSRGQQPIIVKNTEFSPDPLLSEYYLFTKAFTFSSDEDFSSISIESNYSDMVMQYKTNDGSWTNFTGQISFAPSTDFYVLQVRVAERDAARNFIIKIFPMFDDTISTRTPAVLVPNGGPLYPEHYSISIVNFPEGVELYENSYAGEWIEDIPQSIEIIFMPKTSVKTIIFHSAEGAASCGTGGSITGYTSYLNGVLVTDLDDVRINQWNHLVLTLVSADEEIFYLNSNSGRTEESIIEYSFLAGYPSVLTADIVEELYSIISSYHKLSISETPSSIEEGILEGSSPFKAYTYAWAIVGGGGS